MNVPYDIMITIVYLSLLLLLITWLKTRTKHYKCQIYTNPASKTRIGQVECSCPYLYLHQISLLLQVQCAVIAGFLHFLFLASFSWMCLEGIQLYFMLIEVFEAERSRVRWFYAFGYGKFLRHALSYEKPTKLNTQLYCCNTSKRFIVRLYSTDIG